MRLLRIASISSFGMMPPARRVTRQPSAVIPPRKALIHKRIVSSATIALLLLTAPVFSDFMLDLHTANQPATTQPSADDSSVSVLVVPGHGFFTKFSPGNRTVEVSGSIQAMAAGGYRVKIKLDSRGDDLQSVSTTVELKPGEAFNLSGLQNGTFVRSTTLTVRPTPE